MCLAEDVANCVIELSHANSVAVGRSLEPPAKGCCLFEDPSPVFNEKVLEERAGQIGIVEGDAAEHCGQFRLECLKL